MNTTPRLTRSVPFWILLVGSLASIAFGVWLTVDRLGLMTETLLDGTATGVEVYAGQAWTVFAAAFVGAGLVGLVAALALAVARSFVAQPVEVVEAIAWADDDDFQPEGAEPTPAAEEEAVTR
ncbi:dinucleotide-utilizing enzyme [Microbacterium sp. GXF7504]